MIFKSLDCCKYGFLKVLLRKIYKCLYVIGLKGVMSYEYRANL